MDHFERIYISLFSQRLSLIYLRFIDDIFFIWTGSKEQLIRNLDKLSKTKKIKKKKTNEKRIMITIKREKSPPSHSLHYLD